MERRELLKLLGGLPFAVGSPAARPPNIVLILLDDLGWADVGFHGGEIDTPHMDRMAYRGLRLERFYTYPVCATTRAGLMTGRSPMRLGYGYCSTGAWDKLALPLDEVILPRVLRKAGYFSAIVGKYHLGLWRKAEWPNARGFDHFYGFLCGQTDYYEHHAYGGLDWQRNGKTVLEKGYATQLLADEAVRLITGRDRQKPLFLYLPFNAPHVPLQAPEPLLQKYSRIQDPNRRIYAAMVDAVDTAIGKVLEAIRTERIENETLVWAILSDNGGTARQGGLNVPLRGEKKTTWEGGIRNPAVLRWPGRIAGGRTLNQVMSVLDVLPTLAAVAGVTPDNTKPLDGRNMWPAISNEKVEPREDIFFAHDDAREAGKETTWYAVLHEDWKLVRSVAKADGSSRNYLFRINEDPYEKNDLSAGQAELVKDLVQRIQTWEKLQPSGTLRWAASPPEGWTPPKDYALAADECTSDKPKRAECGSGSPF